MTYNEQVTQGLIKDSIYHRAENFQFDGASLAEMPPSKCVSSFILWNECMMLGPHLYQLMATAHIWTEEIDKPKKQAYTTANLSSFCVEASAIMKVSELLPYMEEKLAFWIQHCWSQLWQLWSISYGFTVIVYSSRLIVLYSYHLEGRQTIENHLAHTNTGSYRHIDIPISISVNFVMGFYFAEDLSAKTTKICTHRKFPTIQ